MALRVKCTRRAVQVIHLNLNNAKRCPCNLNMSCVYIRIERRDLGGQLANLRQPILADSAEMRVCSVASVSIYWTSARTRPILLNLYEIFQLWFHIHIRVVNAKVQFLHEIQVSAFKFDIDLCNTYPAKWQYVYSISILCSVWLFEWRTCKWTEYIVRRYHLRREVTLMKQAPSDVKGELTVRVCPRVRRH